MTKQVAKKEEQEIVLAETMPAFMDANSGRGNEDVTVDDLSIPRMDVIQSLSPQRKKNDPAYIEGAEEGMLFNSVTQALYGTEVAFIPVFFRKEYVVWKDRDAGGGFGGAFPSQAEAQKVADDLGNDTHQVVDTAQHFGLIVHSASNFEEVVISMAKSKMKTSRQLNTLCKMSGGDRFSSVYNIKAVEVNGDKGDYYSMTVKRMGYVSEEMYKVGEALYNAVSGGERNVNYVEAEAEEVAEGTEAY
ncbi:MAG: hypothetical protein DRQ39_08190 [Gammaproteobacteria bacterium]|nr:MAG: hypothetical protein DRQ39_08190 [Gammaproteobacteria bacterium]